MHHNFINMKTEMFSSTLNHIVHNMNPNSLAWPPRPLTIWTIFPWPTPLLVSSQSTPNSKHTKVCALPLNTTSTVHSFHHQRRESGVWGAGQVAKAGTMAHRTWLNLPPLQFQIHVLIPAKATIPASCSLPKWDEGTEADPSQREASSSKGPL